jgi:hypothetical protein
MSYLAQGAVVTIEFTLTGGGAGSDASDIAESVTINNTTNRQIAFHLYAYSDFDLAGVSQGDTVSFPATNQVVQQGKSMTVTETVQPPMPSEWEASWYAITLEKIFDDSSLTLSDAIIPQDTGDETFTYQWDISLGAGQTYILNLTNSIRPSSVVNSIRPSSVQLSLVLTNGNAVISWPTNDIPSFQLQATTVPCAPGAWTVITNLPAVVEGQYQVIMPCNKAVMFYRLQF